jgi:hypothetical protein
MMFRIVFCDILPCKVFVDRRFRGHSSLMMEVVRTSETSVDKHFTLQYIPEDNYEHHTSRRENLKSHFILPFVTKSIKSQLSQDIFQP